MRFFKTCSQSLYQKLLLVLACMFLFVVIFHYLNTGPLLTKKVQSKMGLDYGLMSYGLNSDCNGSFSCFINNIPKPQKSNYSRVGDAFFGLENQKSTIDHAEVINRILSDKQFNNTFLVQYLNHMKWVEHSSGKKTLANKSDYVHDYKLAKDILLTMKNKYISPRDDELVIYVRASDKLDSINDKTCKGSDCQSIVQSYPNFLYDKSLEIMKKAPEIRHITIVAANYNMKKRYVHKQNQLFTQILAKLSELNKEISLHSSNDLDEDIFYMATSKHLISSSNIGNLSLLVSKINAE